MGKNNIAVTLIVAFVIGGAGFYGGMQYQKSQGGFAAGRGPGGSGGQFPNGQRPSGAPNGFREGGSQPVSGEITGMDDTTFTVKTQDGSSKIVVYSGSTTVNKTSPGSASDLKVGENVMVIGSQESNGTVTAQTISLGTSMFQRPPGQ